MSNPDSQQVHAPAGDPWTIGDRLRKARVHAVGGLLSQTDLGEKVGLTRATVGGYEAGELDIEKPEIRRNVMRWAMATGWNYAWLRDGVGPWLADGPDGGVTASDLRDAVFSRTSRRPQPAAEIRLYSLAG